MHVASKVAMIIVMEMNVKREANITDEFNVL